jgi:hypothetical protein
MVRMRPDADRREWPPSIVDHAALDVRPAQVDAEEEGM